MNISIGFFFKALAYTPMQAAQSRAAPKHNGYNKTLSF
jgi:hypothetical protein